MTTLFFNIASLLKSYRPFKDLVQRFIDGKFPVEVEGPEGPFFSLLVSELSSYTRGSSIVVLPTEQEAEAVVNDLSVFSQDVVLFPHWENIPYRGITPQAHTAGRRVSVLSRLCEGEKLIVVTYLRALLTPLPERSFLHKHTLHIKVGDEIDPEAMAETLTAYGYLRVPMATVPGEYALRGEVMDVFLPDSEYATRIVFEFDTVEEIRLYDPLTQGSVEKLSEVKIFPSSEILWDTERIEALFRRFKLSPEAKELLTEKKSLSHAELFFPLSFSVPGTLSDYAGEKSIFYLVSTERMASTAETLKKEYYELFVRAGGTAAILPHPEDVLLSYDEILARLKRKVLFPGIRNPERDRVRFSYAGPRSFFGNITYFKEELNALIAAGYTITIFAESDTQASRIRTLLKDIELEIVTGGISSGFALPELKIMAIHESEIFGRRRPPASVKKAKSSVIDTFVELSPGDYVVHVNYGIGRFVAIDRIRALETERDYIKLEYADEETLFIPIEQVNLIQRYIGQEGRPPHLDKIGGKSWENRKKNVKRSVEDLADKLIKLYSRRKNSVGHAFPKDTDWQLEFEAEFPYEETEDQLKSIADVKADMESPRPMDRLVCGDVGFGKTEIAMRAAFKAVLGGKQVAFLAPTTILAEQHFDNFTERFKRYPVKIGMISRFVPRAEQKEILARLAANDLDILIGTHRILQKDVKFADLGLLVVDEEQRFGVKDKERLKELKANVDCLTLSATPIPRTLHMSLLKIRDMSLLTTPPSNRRPIETYIGEFDAATVSEAIRREVDRGGQVFYLHNRVETLSEVQIFLNRIVPEVLVEQAHGQMSSSELEDIMRRFVHGGFHVLLATTIIENGIDIPNVNTIIIDRADMYGISQLYQLRGRVGRSERTAYAYLLYPEERALTELAMKRLEIISDYTELGSGFKIALKDLEVRGAGNLLGREQSGDILSVGFDMYLRLLDEAIAEMSGESEEPVEELYLELEYSGYIPESYIKDPMEKMEIYKKIASIRTEEDLDAVIGELSDRFGPLPEELMSLISISEIRIICRKLSISAVREKEGIVSIEFARVSAISVDKILRLINESGGTVRIDPRKPNVLIMKTGTIGLTEKSEFIRERLSRLV